MVCREFNSSHLRSLQVKLDNTLKSVLEQFCEIEPPFPPIRNASVLTTNRKEENQLPPPPEAVVVLEMDGTAFLPPDGNKETIVPEVKKKIPTYNQRHRKIVPVETQEKQEEIEGKVIPEKEQIITTTTVTDPLHHSEVSISPPLPLPFSSSSSSAVDSNTVLPRESRESTVDVSSIPNNDNHNNFPGKVPDTVSSIPSLPSSSLPVEKQPQLTPEETEKRILDAKLSIVHTYMERNENEKALQQLLMIMKKYEDRQQQSSSSGSTTGAVAPKKRALPKNLRGNSSIPTFNNANSAVVTKNNSISSSSSSLPTKETMIDLYFLRGTLYSLLSDKENMKNDFLLLFQNYSLTQNETIVNRLFQLVDSYSSEGNYLQALQLNEILLPMQSILTPSVSSTNEEEEENESYSSLLFHLQLMMKLRYYSQCIEFLDDLQLKNLSKPFFPGGLLLANGKSREEEREKTGLTQMTEIEKSKTLRNLFLNYYLFCYEQLLSLSSSNSSASAPQSFREVNLFQKLEYYSLKGLEEEILTNRDLGVSSCFFFNSLIFPFHRLCFIFK
jgi:hypothetical protein